MRNFEKNSQGECSRVRICFQSNLDHGFKNKAGLFGLTELILNWLAT